ncbi:hypothetical protein Trydic_g17819 [Trypoxylus dichotomus]
MYSNSFQLNDVEGDCKVVIRRNVRRLNRREGQGPAKNEKIEMSELVVSSAGISRENHCPLTEVELQMGAKSICGNEIKNIIEDIFGGENSDESYVEEQLLDVDSEQRKMKMKW